MAATVSFTQSSMAVETDAKLTSSTAKSVPWRSTRHTTPTLDNFQSQDDASSTDAGEDITPIYVDLSDFTSDSEVGDDCSAASPRTTGSAMTCVYSVMMLLQLRSAASDKDKDPSGLKTRAISDFPAHTAAHSRNTLKPRASSVEESSWRLALPTSSSDSWVAQQKNRDPADDENVTRSARSILNKLTVEKFDSLFEQLCDCGIKQPHHISILMHEIFDKATTQYHFIPMYAELCVKLEKDARIVAVVEEDGGQHNFRRLLLNECQGVFEQLFESNVADAKVDEDSAFRRKQQALGNMKLIGQLLLQGVLSSDLFVECCEELLSQRSQCAEALESLVALIMVASPKFDKASWPYFTRLESIFSEMKKLTKDKAVPPRIRFLFRDVLDARASGWPSSIGARERAPSKLEDVRNNATAVPTQQNAPTQAIAEPTMQTAPGRAAPQKRFVGFAREVPKVSTKAETVPWNAKASAANVQEETFQVVEFRKALGPILDELASTKNIPAAVQRIRLQAVPLALQALLFVDILTRIVEERRGAARRCQLAFVAGLAAAASSAFDRNECLAGTTLFFQDVYTELCTEVQRLPAIIKSEFMPTMLTVFPADELNKIVPVTLRL